MALLRVVRQFYKLEGGVKETIAIERFNPGRPTESVVCPPPPFSKAFRDLGICQFT
ncbi:MAG: hypothetical protein NVSMB64_29940 [Candidatus Velthaea sp.]